MQILHVAPLSEWKTAQESGTYDLSTRGARLQDVGFIHCSTADLIGPVAQAVYSDFEEEIVVLVLDDDLIREAGHDVRYEDGGNGSLYPHIYGPLDVSLVQSVESAGFTSDGDFWWGT